MTSWMKQRDLLVEQTLAFVQGVAAQRPLTVTPAEADPGTKPNAEVSPTFVGPVAVDKTAIETDALLSLMALSQPGPRGDEPVAPPPQPIAVAEPPQQVQAVAKLPLHQPARRRVVELAIPERDIIARRVERFRSGQQRLQQERDLRYATLQARIRANLGNDPSA